MDQQKQLFFDILVIGGGHAGVEASWIASEFNFKVGLLSKKGVPLASAPCNPAIGGVGKGQVVRELDLLGGLMGRLADLSGIQYRTLNESKGPAVQSTRVQIDKERYAQNAEQIIENERDNLEVIRDSANKISECSKDEHLDDYAFKVECDEHILFTKKLIVTTGTFLNGKLHTGSDTTAGGRVECLPSVGLSDLNDKIQKLALRFKTGTPARLHKNSIDYSVMEVQPSDDRTLNFHFAHDLHKRSLQQKDCYLTTTNKDTLTIIRDNKERSPMYNGQISGVGPRYCPSIEDKAFRYLDRQEHHVFIEPEGLDIDTIYPNGISTSLPKDVQESFIRTIPGLENAEIVVYGYAVEYDVVDTTHLDLSLEHKILKNLYFAGQVNGTSGYEEAAGQGHIAGVNAALSLSKRPAFILSPQDSYIGVMIQDLVTVRRDEPYRLFTARSENRLSIREDNTFIRMNKYRLSLGLNSKLDDFLNTLILQHNVLDEILDEVLFKDLPNKVQRILLEKHLANTLYDSEHLAKQSLSVIIKRPEINAENFLMNLCQLSGIELNPLVLKTLGISKKYIGYIKRVEEDFGRLKKWDNVRLNIDQLMGNSNLSFECKQRIEKFRPQTFSQLKQLEGIRPATLVYVASLFH